MHHISLKVICIFLCLVQELLQNLSGLSISKASCIFFSCQCHHSYSAPFLNSSFQFSLSCSSLFVLILMLLGKHCTSTGAMVTETLIDVLLSNKPELFKYSGNYYPSLSDHAMIYGFLKEGVNSNKPRIVTALKSQLGVTKTLSLIYSSNAYQLLHGTFVTCSMKLTIRRTPGICL